MAAENRKRHGSCSRYITVNSLIWDSEKKKAGETQAKKIQNRRGKSKDKWRNFSGWNTKIKTSKNRFGKGIRKKILGDGGRNKKGQEIKKG